MKVPFQGGCACGVIRYECSAQPVQMLQCHCRDCQRSSGGPFVSVVIVPGKALKIVNGSPLLAKFDPAPHLIGIRVGSLDDPSWFRPACDIWTSDAQPWDLMNPELPKFGEYPPFPESK
jgi:hypothetical protein